MRCHRIHRITFASLLTRDKINADDKAIFFTEVSATPISVQKLEKQHTKLFLLNIQKTKELLEKFYQSLTKKLLLLKRIMLLELLFIQHYDETLLHLLDLLKLHFQLHLDIMFLELTI